MSAHVDIDQWCSIPQFAKGTCLGGRQPTSAALATERARPLPSAPPPSQMNEKARQTLKKHPDLFKVITPINVDRFERYLKMHPNQAYVRSVVRALREGFWPWAEGEDPNTWTTYDNSHRRIRTADRLEFVRQQRDEEVKAMRWSPSFGLSLRAGMYSSPIGVVPKSTPGKFRLITDHSHEPYSPNSAITQDAPGFPFDRIEDLISALLIARQKKRPLVLWKSDVKNAYRLMPVHPLWQTRQIMTVDRERFVDRCNTFGSKAGGWVWASFISLVIWIAIKIKKIHDLFGYVDDDFSWEFANETRYYRPYKKYLPAKQARYLELWDELGIPHEERKQMSGSPLTIIGLEVDPNKLSVKLPAERLREVIKAIDEFICGGRAHTVLESQKLAGMIEWTFKVYPFGRPGVRGLHLAMAGRHGPKELIQVDARICHELRWLKSHIQDGRGTLVPPIEKWGQRGDVVIYTDACPTGLGIWMPAHRQGFRAKIPRNAGEGTADLEALAVVAGLDYTAQHFRPSRLVIRSDSLSTVEMFDSLRTRDVRRNALLMAFVNVVRKFSIWCRVFHVRSEENTVADALSRFEDRRVQRTGLDPEHVKECTSTVSKILASLNKP